MTQAPNDSLPGPAALARSLGYAFVVGATVALVLTLLPNSAETNETGILSLVALAYTVGLLCLRAEDRLPSWATPAALALATILVTYAVEFFSDPGQSVWAIFYVAVGLQAGYFLNRLWAAGQVALVAARIRPRRLGPRRRARGVARHARHSWHWRPGWSGRCGFAYAS